MGMESPIYSYLLKCKRNVILDHYGETRPQMFHMKSGKAVADEEENLSQQK